MDPTQDLESPDLLKRLNGSRDVVKWVLIALLVLTAGSSVFRLSPWFLDARLSRAEADIQEIKRTQLNIWRKLLDMENHDDPAR